MSIDNVAHSLNGVKPVDRINAPIASPQRSHLRMVEPPDRRIKVPFDAIPQAFHDDIDAGWIPDKSSSVVAVMLRLAFRAREQGYGDGSSIWATNEAVGRLIDRCPRQVRNIRRALLARGWLDRIIVGPVDTIDPRNRTGERWAFTWMTGNLPRRDPAERPPVRPRRGRPPGGGRKFISSPLEPVEELISTHGGEEMNYRDAVKFISPNIENSREKEDDDRHAHATPASEVVQSSSDLPGGEESRPSEPIVQVEPIAAPVATAIAPPTAPGPELPPVRISKVVGPAEPMTRILDRLHRAAEPDRAPASEPSTSVEPSAGPLKTEADRDAYAAFRIVERLRRRSVLFRAAQGGEIEFYPAYPGVELPTPAEVAELKRLKPYIVKELRDRGVELPDTPADVEAARERLRSKIAKLITDQDELEQVEQAIPGMVAMLEHHTRFPIRETLKAIKAAIAAPKRTSTIARYARGVLDTKINERTFK